MELGRKINQGVIPYSPIALELDPQNSTQFSDTQG